MAGLPFVRAVDLAELPAPTPAPAPAPIQRVLLHSANPNTTGLQGAIASEAADVTWSQAPAGLYSHVSFWDQPAGGQELARVELDRSVHLGDGDTFTIDFDIDWTWD